MDFCVSTSGVGANEVLVLEEKQTGTKAEIFAFGALLNAFIIQLNGSEKNVVYGFQHTADAQQNITPLFQSAKLSPFVCRTKNGEYNFANHKYKLNKYYYQREALHGLLYDAVFTVIDKGATKASAFVTLAYDYYETDAGYPFVYRTEIKYELKENNCLRVSTTLINKSDVSIPVADGWHPYFCLGKSMNDTLLFINANAMVEFDNRLLPTGNYLPYHQFSEMETIGNTAFDNCFVVKENTTQPACLLRDAESGLQLSVIAEKNYPYLQLFIPANRESIAIENLSSLPDSFNNTIGLTTLQPAHSKDFIASYQISVAKENVL